MTEADTAPLVTASRDALADALADAIYPPRDDKPHLLSVFVLAHRVADALIDSGVVRAVDGLAEASSLIYRVTDAAIPLHPTGRVTVTETQAVLRALAAALATPTDPSEA